MFRLSIVRAVLVAAAAAALVPAGAAAKAQPHPKHIVFAAFLRGSQATTWHTESHGSAVTCGSSIVGDGDQMIRFHVEQPALITVSGDGPVAPEFNHGLQAEADVERGAEFRAKVPLFDPRTRTCHGTRTLPPTPMPGCGERSGKIELMLGFTPQSVGGTPPDEDLTPLSRPNQLRFRGINPDFGGGPLLGQYPSCPLQEPDINYPATRGELFEAIERLSEKRLLSVRRGGVITVSASRVVKFTLPRSGYGQTAVTYNLKLRAISRG